MKIKLKSVKPNFNQNMVDIIWARYKNLGKPSCELSTLIFLQVLQIKDILIIANIIKVKFKLTWYEP